MEHAEYLDAARTDLAAMRLAVASGPLDTRVPTCPDFDVDDLARHVAAFCIRWTEVVRDGRTAAFRPIEPDEVPLDPGQRAEWLGAIGDELLDLLAATPPELERWSWYPLDRTAGFIARRVAHELCLHRVDLQLARGVAGPIDPELAADGIEEVFLIRAHHSRFEHDPVRGSGRSLHLHGTDMPAGVPAAEWMVTLAPDGVRVSHEHGKGDLALRGAVGDLERLLYQRPTYAPVEVFGDESVLTEFHGVFTF
ncbi:MAG: maleylpyruvate isomerase family mycothiol-dependent enzyme [Microthrixaceae bacterium]